MKMVSQARVKITGGGSTSYITKAGKDYTYFDLGNEWDTIKTET